MSRALTQFLRNEYARFLSVARDEWRVDSGHVQSVANLLPAIHKRYLSLACAATISGYRAKRNQYSEGVVEVGHLSLVLALKGLDNPSCVLLRQSIELVLKHIFFSSHPVEYGWAQSRPDYKDLTFQSLLEYIRRTDQYRCLADQGQLCNNIDHWYSILSRYVHVHTRGFMGYSKSGSGYRPSKELLTKLDERTKGVWPDLIVLLVIFHTERLCKASLIEQRLVKNALRPEHRSLF